MEFEKVVKERDELNIKIAKWEESSKSLNILLNSQMSAHDKNGLGYGTQLNKMSDKSETDSEISMSVFEVRSSDEESTPANDRFSTGVRVGTEGATTTTSGLDAGLDSGNIHESPLRSREAPLYEGHTSGNAEDSLQLKELIVLVPKLVTRIATLEKELHQTKTTYGKAVLTLVERVKSLEVALKRQTKKVVVSDLVDEETKNQGRKFKILMMILYASGEVQEQDISPTTLKADKTLSQVISQKANSTDKGIRYKRKTRSKSIEKDISTDLDADISRVLTRTGLVNPVRPNGKRAVHTVSTARPISTTRPVSTARPFAPKIA
ncbi:hypothetical protein Tco_0711993 [Tanacetum coccineum]